MVIPPLLDAGLVGLCLSYALNVTGALNMLVRNSSDVETNMVGSHLVFLLNLCPSGQCGEDPGVPGDYTGQTLL